VTSTSRVRWVFQIRIAARAVLTKMFDACPSSRARGIEPVGSRGAGSAGSRGSRSALFQFHQGPSRGPFSYLEDKTVRGITFQIGTYKRMPVLGSLFVMTLNSFFISLIGGYIDHGDAHRLMNGRKGFDPLAEAFYLGSCGHGRSLPLWWVNNHSHNSVCLPRRQISCSDDPVRFVQLIGPVPVHDPPLP